MSNEHETDGPYLQHIIDEIPVMVWVCDLTKSCHAFNAQWLAFTGRTIEQELGYGWAEGVHPADLKRCISIFEGAFDRREPFQMEYRLRHHSGEYRWISDQGQPRHDRAGEFIGYFGTGVDLTVQYEALADNAKLRTELGQARRVEGLGRLASTLAHEFNNILMGISPFAELLMRGSADETRRIRAASSILETVKRGRAVVMDVMRFARPVEARMERLDLSTWLVVEVERLQTSVGATTLECSVPDIPVYVSADHTQLAEALAHLVSNARDAVAGIQGGRIAVDLSASSVHAMILVRDNGCGVASGDVSKIFEPLYSTKAGGTGLGLSVVRSVADQHDAHLSFTSEAGMGTSVTLTFALVEPPIRLECDRRYDAAEAEPRAVRVLVVEDEDAISEGLQLLLSDEGFEVMIAADGAAAIRLMQTRVFDVMILDLGLPDMDGADVLLHAQEHAPTLPVIVTSGHGYVSRVASEGLGCVEQLPKPYEISELVRVVRRVLGSRGAQTPAAL